MEERKTIYLCLAHMSETGEEQKYVKEAFDTNWVVPLGPNVNGFEDDLKAFVSKNSDGSELSREVVALSAGTAAVHLGLLASGVGPGDEVCVQSFTFCASSHPITYLGATPVFIDSEPDSWNMDPELLEKAIIDRKEKTGKYPKAIVPVALYGMPYDCDKIMAISEKYGIPVVEDAAEGCGSRWKGQVLGTFGKFGVLSFNGNKMITTSGGGALICQDAESKNNVMWYATQARDAYPYYQHTAIGYNYRMSNVCAGIGRGQMTVLDEHIAHHRHVHALYEKAFKGVDGITLKSNPDGRFNANYWLSTILIDPVKTGTTYDEVRRNLDEQGIETRPLWKPMHLQPVYATNPCYVNGVSERLFNMGLCIPAGPWVTDEDVAYIVEQTKGCCMK